MSKKRGSLFIVYFDPAPCIYSTRMWNDVIESAIQSRLPTPVSTSLHSQHSLRTFIARLGRTERGKAVSASAEAENVPAHPGLPQIVLRARLVAEVREAIVRFGHLWSALPRDCSAWEVCCSQPAPRWGERERVHVGGGSLHWVAFRGFCAGATECGFGASSFSRLGAVRHPHSSRDRVNPRPHSI